MSFARSGLAATLLKFTLVLAAFGLSSYTVVKVLLSLAPNCWREPCLYMKDIVQDYLLAMAVRGGIYPYLPMPDLARRFIGPVDVQAYPAAHPPPVAIIFLPLTWLTYEQAVPAWLLLECVCLLVSIRAILCGLGMRCDGRVVALVFVAALGFRPLRAELLDGQLMTLSLLLLVGAWLALRSGKAVQGGALLGCIVLIKLIGWPLLLLLIARGNWRAFVTASLVVVGSNVVAVLVMGPAAVAGYYLGVGPAISEAVRNWGENVSLFTLGSRLFETTGSTILRGATVSPILQWPYGARFLSYGLPIAVVVVGLVLVRRRSLEIAFFAMVCISTIVNPIAWDHYFLLAAIPIAFVGSRLASLGWPVRATSVLVAVALLVFVIPDGPIVREGLAVLVASSYGSDHPATVPLILELTLLLPTFGMLLLAWLVWYLGAVKEQVPGVRLGWWRQYAVGWCNSTAGKSRVVGCGERPSQYR